MGGKAALLAVVLALVAAAQAGATTRPTPLQGVVVGHAHGLVLVASANGTVKAIRGSAAVGARVAIVRGRLVATRAAAAARPALVLRMDRRNDGAEANRVEIEAVVASVGASTVTLTIAGQAVTIPLPAGVTVPASAVGTMVELELSFAAPQQAVADEDDDAVAAPAIATAPPAATGFDDHGGHDGGDGQDGGDDGGHGGGGH
jgi:hypothetical protein